MKNKNKFNKLLISGMSLPIAMMFTIGGSGILYAYYSQLYARNWNVNYKIAKYKAKLNANSGIAHAMANYLYRRDFHEALDKILDESTYLLGNQLDIFYPKKKKGLKYVLSAF